MSINLVGLILIFTLNHASLNGEIYKTSEINNNYPVFPQCINETHDNLYSYKTYNETSQQWQDIVNKMYSKGVCGAWSSFASILTTNTILTLSGFASNGITSGTLAASIQSYFGNVAAGSFFSYLQGLGAVGGVSMFGSITFGTFIAWSVICGDFIDININFMNENATQCFMNEKVLYISLEQAEEITNWAKQSEVSNNVKDRLMNTMYDAKSKTNDMFAFINAMAIEMDQKYEIKKKLSNIQHDAVKYGKEKVDALVQNMYGYFGIF